MNESGTRFGGNVITTGKNRRSTRVKRVLVRRANNVRARHSGENIKRFALGKLKLALLGQ